MHSQMFCDNKYNSIIKIRHDIINALNHADGYYKHQKNTAFKSTGNLFIKQY